MIFFITVHGNWAQWSEMGDCSADCGDGIKTRTRTCSSPVPLFGGNTCEGGDTEEESCKITECPGKFTIQQYAAK